jgi:hypothetical protein
MNWTTVAGLTNIIASMTCGQILSLLKIQAGAIEGRDKQRASSPILRGSKPGGSQGGSS